MIYKFAIDSSEIVNVIHSYYLLKRSGRLHPLTLGKMSVKTVNKQHYQTMSCQEQTPKKLRK